MMELMICPYGVTKHQLTEQMSHKPYGHRTPRGPGHSPEGGCVLREAKSWHFIQMSHKLQLWKRAASCLLEVPFPPTQQISAKPLPSSRCSHLGHQRAPAPSHWPVCGAASAEPFLSTYTAHALGSCSGSERPGAPQNHLPLPAVSVGLKEKMFKSSNSL